MIGRGSKPLSSGLASARRDAVVLSVLIIAVLLLIWNGSAFFSNIRVEGEFASDVRLASTALTLNVALILFGWRRYVDLQHEAEVRAEQEQRAALLATTDSATGLFNRKGFADRVGQLQPKPPPAVKIWSSSPSRSIASNPSTTSTATRPGNGC